MKLPKIIKVGYHNYSVVEWTDIEVELSGTWGQCDKNKKVIYICTSAKPKVVADILIHECFHAIWEFFNLEEEESEEKAISILSSGLVDLLARNPKVLEFIYNNIGAKDEA